MFAEDKTDVVPYVGTWIEIGRGPLYQEQDLGRSLRGNVDRNVVEVKTTKRAEGRSLRGNVDRHGIG